MDIRIWRFGERGKKERTEELKKGRKEEMGNLRNAEERLVNKNREHF